MEGAERETKTQSCEALRSQTAIRCAKAALLLSSLKSSPNRRLNNPIDHQDVTEKEMLKKEIGDLKAEVVMERLKNKRIKLCGLFELFVEVVLLLAIIFIFFFFYFRLCS